MPAGFEWIDHHNSAQSVISFIRRGLDAGTFIVVVCNFSPIVRSDYRLGVPEEGDYRERLNTDSVYYGGSNTGTSFGVATAEPVGWHGQPHSIVVTLPPLATVLLQWTA